MSLLGSTGTDQGNGKGRDAAVMGEDYQPSTTEVRSEPVQGRRFEVCDAHGEGISEEHISFSLNCLFGSFMTYRLS